MGRADDATDDAGPLAADPDSRLAAAVVGSRLVAALDRAGDRFSGIGRGSRGGRITAWTRRTVADSFVYRWLTAEPEPEVIVIDLRETATVGPVVAAVDRIVSWLGAATDDSRAVALARGLLAEFHAAPVRLLGATVALGCAGVLLAGTVLGALGIASTTVLAALAAAGLGGTRVTASWTDLVDSRPGRAVVAALEPPDPDTADERGPPE